MTGVPASAASLDPDAALEQARQFRAQGRVNDAIVLYRTLIERNPQHAVAHNGLGVALAQARRFGDAITAFRAATEAAPDYPEAFNNLGNALEECGQGNEAVAAFRTAILQRPSYGRAHLNLAETLRRLQRFQEAEDVFRLTTQLLPTSAEAFYGLGVVLEKQKRVEEAIGSFQMALRLKPDFAEAHNELGGALQSLGRHDEADSEYRTAIAHSPAYAEAYTNLGNSLCERGRYQEAEVVLRRAIEIRADIAETHHNLGVALSGLARLAEAGDCFRRAVALSPDFAEAHFHLGSALLMQGRYEEGWPEYEWRLRFADQSITPRQYSVARWQGEPLNGRTIFLTTEQGLGDTIQMVRFATTITLMGGHVILEVPPSLDRLCRSVPGVAQTTPMNTVPATFDLHAPLMSLPGILRTTIKSIPSSIPYVYPQTADVSQWNARLASYARPRVGLVWSGDPRAENPHAFEFDRRRSLALRRLAPLIDMAGVTFFSLQKGSPQSQLTDLPSDRRPIDMMDAVRDFADTAALIANLDLVITVDTSVAHLAGALGKAVWILVRFDHDWRWLLDRDDSPWYPTARLFRQTTLGDWDPVIARVAAALAQFAAAHRIA
ncbi:MAG TPA: tetratricopeptide repeat protein [Magnetospirillaceae bacterium]